MKSEDSVLAANAGYVDTLSFVALFGAVHCACHGQVRADRRRSGRFRPGRVHEVDGVPRIRCRRGCQQCDCEARRTRGAQLRGVRSLRCSGSAHAGLLPCGCRCLARCACGQRARRRLRDDRRSGNGCAKRARPACPTSRRAQHRDDGQRDTGRARHARHPVAVDAIRHTSGGANASGEDVADDFRVRSWRSPWRSSVSAHRVLGVAAAVRRALVSGFEGSQRTKTAGGFRIGDRPEEIVGKAWPACSSRGARNNWTWQPVDGHVCANTIAANLVGSAEAVHFQVGDSIRSVGGSNADYVGVELKYGC